MRACRVCGRLYPDDAGFCPVDGQGLYEAAQVAVSVGEHEDARVGQVIFDRYQIRRIVADGGMGRVYEALDTQESRHVAIKILHAHTAQDEVAVARFRREFEVSKEMSSLHIVEVLDCKPTADGSYALIMEFLYGEELRATLRREGGLSAERLVRLLSQVAYALEGPHDRAVVHRDLKPDNLFLCQTPDGDMLKVLDFGSARDNADSAEKLTVMGTTIGSPFYMPPEQAQALDSLDHRADVWALAVIAYECLTGTVPFRGPNGPSILLEILTKDPVAPGAVEGRAKIDIPRAVDTAVLRALKRPVEERTASVGILADEVGKGFGLRGDHRQWAYSKESELREKVAAVLPGLMEETTLPRAALSVTSAFFGGASTGLSSPPSTDTAGHRGPLVVAGVRRAPSLLIWLGLVAVLCGLVVAYWLLV